jgi:hypothetical protein
MNFGIRQAAYNIYCQAARLRRNPVEHAAAASARRFRGPRVCFRIRYQRALYTVFAAFLYKQGQHFSLPAFAPARRPYNIIYMPAVFFQIIVQAAPRDARPYKTPAVHQPKMIAWNNTPRQIAPFFERAKRPQRYRGVFLYLNYVACPLAFVHCRQIVLPVFYTGLNQPDHEVPTLLFLRFRV